MSILNDLLVKVVMQDIINANSIRAMQNSFNTLFNIKSIANFYAMGFNLPLVCYYFERFKNSTIKDSTN